MKEKTILTPWEVKGRIDYKKVIKDFGLKEIDDKLKNRLKKYTNDLHFLISRNYFFAHRDLNWLLDEYEKGNKFYLYTGRGPSNKMHIGHLPSFVLTKWFQDKFNADVVIQITNDEKFLFKDLDLDKTTEYGLDNLLDILAIGFNLNKTKVIIDTYYSKTLYNNAIKVAKRITASTVKAVFGLKDSDNIGKFFYTSIQAVPAFIMSVWKKKNVPCLIPHGIDQDPHFRITRDILPKLGYYKPASIQSKFLSGLKSVDSKMSSSDPNSTIFLDDEPNVVKKKIMKYAFSGGQPNIEEHRKKGANLDVDVSYQWLKIFFEPDDKKLNEITQKYKSGELLTGEIKLYLVDKINKFLKKHNKAKEKVKNKINKVLLID